MKDAEDDFCKRMRKATRQVHAISDALVNAKLALGLSDNQVWADGLLVFYEIFKFMEEAMFRLKDSPVGLMYVKGLERTEAFEKDLEYYLGKDWKKTYQSRKSVTDYLKKLQEVERSDSILLIAYIYHLYMGLLSGGMILRKKMILKNNLFGSSNFQNGYNITEFEGTTVHQLKTHLRFTINKIVSVLSEEKKEELIKESKTVFELNNKIIKSIKIPYDAIIKSVPVIVFVVALMIVIMLQILR
ncbi:heme oxygenase [Trichogramma pretiosum]|uniref:heme oxygenase n=1 Tax=Trichogramma pretiosum TaxID=7493 RepID=UPI0006C96D4B|nr:heme oxygenase [Trichogramma pretiosum]